MHKDDDSLGKTPEQAIVEVVPLRDLILGLQPAERLISATHALAYIADGVHGKGARCNCCTCDRPFTTQKRGGPMALIFMGDAISSRPIAAICYSCLKHPRLAKLVERALKLLPFIEQVNEIHKQKSTGTIQ